MNTEQFINELRELLETKAEKEKVKLKKLKQHLGTTPIFRKLLKITYQDLLNLCVSPKEIEALATNLSTGVAHALIVDKDYIIIDGGSRATLLTLTYGAEKEVEVKKLPISCTENTHNFLLCLAIMLKTMHGKHDSQIFWILYEKAKPLFEKHGIDLDRILGKIVEDEEVLVKVKKSGTQRKKKGKIESIIENIKALHAKYSRELGLEGDTILREALRLVKPETIEALVKAAEKIGRKTLTAEDIARTIYITVLRQNCLSGRGIIQKIVNESRSRLNFFYLSTKLLEAQGLTLEEVMEKIVDKCLEKATKILESYNIPNIDKHREELRKELIDLAGKGRDPATISALLVYKILSRYRKTTEKTYISKIYGVSPATIRHWLRQEQKQNIKQHTQHNNHGNTEEEEDRATSPNKGSKNTNTATKLRALQQRTTPNLHRPRTHT